MDILKLGSTGPEVEKLQQALNSNGSNLLVDGKFRDKTDSAVRDFQTKKALVVDGKVGSITWAKLLKTSASSVSPELPKSYDDVYRIFGDPDSPGWEENNLAFCSVDDSLRAFSQRKGIRGFTCHRLLVPVFQSVFAEIVKAGLQSELKSYDGCFNNRPIRGSSTKSLHAWAIAIDINADDNPMGSTGKLHPGIIAAFKKFNFFYGGDFHGRTDPMHMEFFNRGQV